MMTRFGLAAAVVAAALGAWACGSATTAATGSGVTKITSTTSFGMCAGYCKTTLELTSGQAVLTREGWGRGTAGGNLPAERTQAAVSAKDWQEIAELAAAAKIETLPDRIGCPDCADGGAESLTIVGTGRNKTIAFDHGADIKEAQPLLKRVREFRAKLMPKK